MDIDPKHDEEIEKINASFKCPKNFMCYRSGFENLCKAKDWGLEGYLLCLEEVSYNCTFASSFDPIRFCRCPLRNYIAKELKK